jgi:hypothetical protein
MVLRKVREKYRHLAYNALSYSLIGLPGIPLLFTIFAGSTKPIYALEVKCPLTAPLATAAVNLIPTCLTFLLCPVPYYGALGL